MKVKLIPNFRRDGELRIVPAPNGGWAVYQGSDRPHLQPDFLAAFSSSVDLCLSLSETLAAFDKT